MRRVDGLSRCTFLLATLVALASVVCLNAAGADSGYFATSAPGAELPSGESCAERVRRSPWEPRPENYAANHAPGAKVAKIDGTDAESNLGFAKRIDGNFTGTTDEIIQWGACKWGFDENITRARAVQESYWRQSKLGDMAHGARTCALIGQDAPCWQSYGILQVKGTIHEGTYPAAERSTAFNVDYTLAWLRACYEGAFAWLGSGYRAGDEWGCVGAWYSGKWYDGMAAEYIQSVKEKLADQSWTKSDF